MPTHRISWSWSPAAQEDCVQRADNLVEALSESARDRASSAASITVEAAERMRAWINAQDESWSFSAAAADLEAGWGEWAHHQGWRGPCAAWIDALRCTYREARDAGGAPGPRQALLTELDAWLAEAPADVPRHQGESREAGFAARTRLGRPEDVCPHALRRLGREETILIHGYSETALGVVTAAQKAGLFPEVLLAQGAADQSGLRSARHLANHGVRVRLAWDVAVVANVDEVDRIWLGTEAVGAGAFLAPVGTSLLLEQAERLEVPAAVLCTVDKLVPGGSVQLPPWGEEESWNLWAYAPEGVELSSQPLERVDAEKIGLWLTEAGEETLAEFCTRGLKPYPAPPCVA